jgi:DNA-binding transcriptional MerR regulator
MDGYPVGEVARLARISVRTLHHYDGIGLLTPSARSAGGYRLYSETDLDRLRRVLFYRELEFGLDQIAEILADAATGTDDHLRRQHRLLRERRRRREPWTPRSSGPHGASRSRLTRGHEGESGAGL